MATPLPRSSSTLLSQVLNDSSVMISSSYKLSKYDLMKPGREIQSKRVKVRFSLRGTNIPTVGGERHCEVKYGAHNTTQWHLLGLECRQFNPEVLTIKRPCLPPKQVERFVVHQMRDFCHRKESWSIVTKCNSAKTTCTVCICKRSGLSG